MATQHEPNVTDRDVERIIKRDFEPEQAIKAAALIRLSSWSDMHRVILACLKTADGDLTRLKQQLDDDWRDIICAAEYPQASALPWDHLAALSDAEQQRIYDDDRQQYLEWLNCSR